ncbi:MAG: STAS domain-containing protein [Burkholderiales bacterium]|nr:MAG: STAS domain-containing protein [Burkholderiales bacterium]
MPTCPAEIVMQGAPAALQAAREALAGGGGSLDLSPLVRFDSSAVAVLVALRREAGSGAAFRNPPANLRKLASLYGVEAALFGPPAR